MVQLGKYVKGRAPNNNDKRHVQIRIRHQDKQMEDLVRETQLMNMRRENLKSQMIEEQKMAHFNRMKILTHWRKVLRLAKTEQLKKDIQIFQQNHDREVDAKDAILQMLDRDLDEAEEQYGMAFRNHLIHIDDLIKLQNSRLLGLQVEFEMDFNMIKNEYDRERADIEFSHNMEYRELNEMIKTIEEEEQQKLRDMSDTHDGLREETKNKNVEELESMKHELIKQIEKLDKEFEVHFNKYVADTEQKATHYRTLLEDNRTSANKIGDSQKQIETLRTQSTYWGFRKKQNQLECKLRNDTLQQELKKLVSHYHLLKKKMAHLRGDKEKHLGTLSLDALNCTTKLKEYQSLGEKILKTAELCRKLETEKEKVLPFYQSDADTMNEPDIDIDKINGLDKNNAFGEFKMLDNFYKRFNKVHLDKLAIEKQKATLEKENLFFKNLLKQYLDGVSVNDDVMNANNPLLVVNNKVNLNRPPVVPDDGRNITKIEGNFEVNNLALQRNANYN